jgi:hypothetical protein
MARFVGAEFGEAIAITRLTTIMLLKPMCTSSTLIQYPPDGMIICVSILYPTNQRSNRGFPEITHPKTKKLQAIYSSTPIRNRDFPDGLALINTCILSNVVVD